MNLKFSQITLQYIGKIYFFFKASPDLKCNNNNNNNNSSSSSSSSSSGSSSNSNSRYLRL